MSVTHPWEGPHCGTRGYASSVSTNFQGKPVSKEIASHGEEMNIQNPSLLNWCSVSIYDHFSLCFKVHVVPADNSLFCPCNSKTYCVEDWKIKPSLYHLAKWPVALCTALQKILGFFLLAIPDLSAYVRIWHKFHFLSSFPTFGLFPTCLS